MFIAGLQGVYGFRVKGGPGGLEGYWVVDAKTGAGSVEFNGKGENKQKMSGTLMVNNYLIQKTSLRLGKKICSDVLDLIPADQQTYTASKYVINYPPPPDTSRG